MDRIISRWLTFMIIMWLGSFDNLQAMPIMAQGVAGADSITAKGDANQANNVRLLSQSGGMTSAVFVVGNRAYLGEGPRLTIWDISQPSFPILLGKTAPFAGFVSDVMVVNEFAYVAAGEAGLRVVNIANPAAPREIGFYNTPWPAMGLYVSGNTVYVAAEFAGLRVVDVTTPTAPRELGFYDTPGYAQDVYVVGNIAYIADYTNGLRIINVADPKAPTETGFYDTPGSAYSVYVAGNYAYVADESGLRVVNVVNPANPSEASFLNTISAYDVYVVGVTAYIASEKNGVYLIDVSNPITPIEAGLYDTPGEVYAVSVVDNTAYVADQAGVRILNVANRSSPSEIGVIRTLGWVNGVQVVGNTAYLANYTAGLQVLDVTDPTTLNWIGGYDTQVGYSQNVYVTGGRAYVADYNAGLWIGNVNPPSALSQLGIDTSFMGYPSSVQVIGNMAYIAAGEGGFYIKDVTNPAAPNEVGHISLPSYAYDVHVVGNIAYVAGYTAGLRVVDVTNPTNPKEIGFYDTSGFAEGVYVAGNLAYVADSVSGLRIINVTNPSTPMEVGFFDTLGQAEDVHVMNNIAYVADAWGGLRVVNVADPARPVEIGFYDTPGAGTGVFAVGNTIYLADSAGGLSVLAYQACYRLTLTPQGAGDAPLAIPSNSDGCPVGEYVAGATINLHAAPAMGSQVAAWDGIGAAAGRANDALLVMPATPHTVTVTYTATALPVGHGDGYEDDDTCLRARTIATDGVVQFHTFHEAGDSDWLYFAAQANTPYRITVNVPADSPADVVLVTRNRCDGTPVEAYNQTFAPGLLTTISRTVAGPVYLQLSNLVTTVTGSAVSYQIAVRPLVKNQGNSALILVAGSLARPDRLQSNIDRVVSNLYQFYRSKGYRDDDIYFLTTNANLNGRDGDATLANLEFAITNWAKTRLDDQQNLTLYLMDHGDPDRFYLDNSQQQVLTPDQLDGWLDRLEEARPGLKITVIVEACYSGSFIEGEKSVSLAESGRLVLTSTAAKHIAYASASGAYFSDFFLSSLQQGYSLAESFRIAYGVTEELFGQEPEGQRQEPQLDANGNGIANERADVILSTQFQAGYDEQGSVDNLAPYVEHLYAPSAIINRRGVIGALVHDDHQVKRVWAVIKPPSFQPPNNSTELAPEVLPTIVLLEQHKASTPDEYTATFAAEYPGFDEIGTYQVMVYAEDEQGLVGNPKVIAVHTGSQVFLPLVRD